MSAERPAHPTDLISNLLRRIRALIPIGASTSPIDKDDTTIVAPGDLGPAILRAQVKVIRGAFGDNVVTATADGLEPPKDDADTHYLYRAGHALVQEQDLDRVGEYFAHNKHFTGGFKPLERLTDGLRLVRLPARTDGSNNVLATIEELERDGIVEGGALTPDHVVFLTPQGRMCPATEPEEMHHKVGPWPPVAPCPEKVSQDQRVRVAVVDSGLWTDAVGSPESPWMEVDDIFADPSDVEIVNPSAIHPYAGHGTFVAGVIACVAPETRVEVEGVLTHGGAIYESEICRQLHQALTDDDHPQIVSISAGTYSRHGHALLSFTTLASAHKLSERDDVLIVAAAGNDGDDEPFWPAAFPWVVSVGSVDPDSAVSDFSNFGDWVDVYARGRDIRNAFPHGSYTCYEPPNVGEVRTFKGVAQWSGTSFSTPIVTGLIAARMRDTGESAQVAWANVKAGATSSVDPRVGPIETVGPLT